MSRDFSLVAWSTDTAVDIVTTTPETTPFKRDGWPLLERQSDDMNAASESGADNCFRTPQQMSINTFTQAAEPIEFVCGTGNASLWFNGSIDEPGFMYVAKGVCGFPGQLGILQSFTFPQVWWDQITISEGSVLVSSTDVGDGKT